jgi:hypothetical protein
MHPHTLRHAPGAFSASLHDFQMRLHPAQSRIRKLSGRNQYFLAMKRRS